MQNNSGHLSRRLVMAGVRLVLMMVPMVTLAQPTLLLDSLKLSNGTGTLTLQAPAAGSSTFAFPSSGGTNRQGMQTDGASVQSWVTTGPVALDNFSDAKAGGTNFGNAFIIGHQTTGGLVGSAGGSTMMGVDAYKSVTSGVRHVGIGYSVLSSFVSGGSTAAVNTAIGSRALSSYTTQLNGTAVGYQAAKLTTASEVTAVGSQAIGNGGGQYTVAVGYRAGYSATSANSVIIGADAFSAASTGASTIAIGYQAMASAVTGAHNTGIGTSVAGGLTSGTRNIAIGTDAMDVLSTGNNNVAIGHGAGASLVSGSGCVFLGYDAGATATASDVLAIDNSTIAAPLVAGDFSTNVVTINGSLSITKGVRAGAAASATVVGNAIAVSAATCSAIHITSDNNGVTDVLTINNGADGSVLYVGFTSTTAEQFEIAGTTFAPGANSVGLTLCRINGTWRVVSMASI
jgi:hypothetical protein